MLKVYFLFALIWPLVFSSDVCEQIELGNATAVCCERNTTFRVGQMDVSFVPYRSHICPIGDGGIENFCPRLLPSFSMMFVLIVAGIVLMQ